MNPSISLRRLNYLEISIWSESRIFIPLVYYGSFGPFSDGEFDVQVKRTLTRKQTNEIKAHPEIYKFVPQNQRFDYFGDTPFYDFECRLVRFKITEDTYECILTNLDENEFSMQDIKKSYRLR